MTTSSVSTFVACGGMFVLSFFAIWAFWFVEKLRGDSAPQVADLTPHRGPISRASGRSQSGPT